jgi:uncharacterized protein
VVVALAISWLIWSPLILTGQSNRFAWVLYYAGVAGPAIAAFLCAKSETVVSRQVLLRRVMQLRVRPAWYAAAAGLPFLAHIVALVSIMVAQGRWWRPALRPSENIIWTAVVVLLLVPLEEIGWRGYALPLLQHRCTAFASSLIVAAIWALWHLPLAWAPIGFQKTSHPWSYMLIFAVTIIPISCLSTWLFRRTGESIVVVSLFHAAVNMADFIVDSPAPLGRSVLLATCLIYSAVVIVVWSRDKSLRQQLRGA